MAMESNDAAAAIMLTSGASGRVNALLSLRAWKSLLMLINAFLLILLFPFRGRRRCSISSAAPPVSSCSSEKGGKEEKGKGLPAVRVPATIVPWKSCSTEVAARRALAIRRVTQEIAADDVTVREFSLFGTSRGDTLFTQTWTPASMKIGWVLICIIKLVKSHI